MNQARRTGSAIVHDDLISVPFPQHQLSDALRVEPRDRALRVMTGEPVAVQSQDAPRSIARRQERAQLQCCRRRRIFVYITKPTTLEVLRDRGEVWSSAVVGGRVGHQIPLNPDECPKVITRPQERSARVFTWAGEPRSRSRERWVFRVVGFAPSARSSARDRAGRLKEPSFETRRFVTPAQNLI